MERLQAPSPLRPLELDGVIQERLAVPERPLKMLMAKLNAIAKSQDGEDLARAVTSFTLELEAFVLNVARIEAVAQQTTVEEMKQYEMQVSQIEEERLATEESIEALKRELVDVRQERQNKLAYDELANEIMKYGTREELTNSLTGLQEAIESLEGDSQKYTEVMKSSEARFEGIASQLEALRAEVGHEVGERERRAVERGREGADDDVADAPDGRQGGGGGGGVGEELDGEEREDERGGKHRSSLNPSAPTFKPLRGFHSEGAGDVGASRASTPGVRSTRSAKRARGDAEGERDTFRDKKKANHVEEGEMSEGEEDEEEEGAA